MYSVTSPVLWIVIVQRVAKKQVTFISVITQKAQLYDIKHLNIERGSLESMYVLNPVVPLEELMPASHGPYIKFKKLEFWCGRPKPQTQNTSVNKSATDLTL